MANVDPPVPGTLLGERYVVGEAIGEAPGYIEYRVRDLEIQTDIALWWMRPELFADPARRDAVLGSGVELRALKDPALRTCYGVGRGTGGLWATWQQSTGTAIVPDASGNARALADVRRWIGAVARGLGVLHAHGLVHGRLVARDVVSIGGVLKVGGGGLWRDVDPVEALRRWSAAASDHYLAPEVRRYQPPTPASDVWSLAMIALELVSGVPGWQPECARAAARRHPSLGAVLVGAMSPDPGRRPELAALLEALMNAGEAPYADASPAAGAPRGKGVARGGEPGTLVGHASAPVLKSAPRGKAPTTPPPGRNKAPTMPPPLPAAKPMRTQHGLPPKPGAFSPEPASFALPTPPAAPHAPRPSAPVVAVGQPPRTSIPTPARHAIAGAVERARTAAPGEFVVQAVSLKAVDDKSGPVQIPGGQPPPAVPDVPTGETPAVPKAKVRNISDVAGGRTYSVAPGQMGYLAPPKAVSDARKASAANRTWLVVALIAVAVLVGGGVALALLL